MIQDNPEIDKFKQQLRDSLQNETLNSRSVKVPRHENVYNSGDGDGMIYFIETGQPQRRHVSPPRVPQPWPSSRSRIRIIGTPLWRQPSSAASSSAMQAQAAALRPPERPTTSRQRRRRRPALPAGAGP